MVFIKSQAPSAKIDGKLLFIKYGNFHKHVFISIVFNSEKYIKILTSFITLEILLEPNLCSPQIYPIFPDYQNPGCSFILEFFLRMVFIIVPDNYSKKKSSDG